jgi:hypothetical protein
MSLAPLLAAGRYSSPARDTQIVAAPNVLRVGLSNVLEPLKLLGEGWLTTQTLDLWCSAMPVG